MEPDQGNECKTTLTNKESIQNSCRKSWRPLVARSLNFTPLRLGDIQKDILEAANEPLNIVNILESDDEKDEDVSVSQNEETCGKHDFVDKINEREIIVDNNEQNEISNNSEKYPVNNENFPGNKSLFTITERFEDTNGIKVLGKIDLLEEKNQLCFEQDNFENKGVEVGKTRNDIEKYNKKTELTPFNRRHALNLGKENVFHTPAPRIQCSIDMGPLLKTPLDPIKLPKYSLSTGKFKTPLSFNPPLTEHFNKEVLKRDKGFGSLRKQFANTSSSTTRGTPFKQLQNGQRDIENGVQSIHVDSGLYLFNSITVNGKVYIQLKELGKGGSSVVYFCFDPTTKEERAIKKVFLSGSKSSAIEYINEIEILRKLQKCRRIIKMYDSEIQTHPTEGKLLLVVLEKGGMDLNKILKMVSSKGKPLATHIIMFYWMEMLYAVKQIHENGIIHSDLKPANFIKAECSLKLIDFGIASCIQNDTTSVVKNVAVGSFEYISPEALLNDNSRNGPDSPSFGKPKFKISFRSDVWSLGCILYQLVYGTTPFHHIGNISAKLTTIMDPNHKISFPAADRVPEKFLNTIKKCLHYNVKQRPSVNELINDFEH